MEVEPPPYQKTARMARYVLHNAGKSDIISESFWTRDQLPLTSVSLKEWASVATISSRPEIESYPFSNVFSVSDGATTDTSSGVPYFYLSVLEMSVHDLQVRSCMLQLLQ